MARRAWDMVLILHTLKVVSYFFSHIVHGLLCSILQILRKQNMEMLQKPGKHRVKELLCPKH